MGAHHALRAAQLVAGVVEYPVALAENEGGRGAPDECQDQRRENDDQQRRASRQIGGEVRGTSHVDNPDAAWPRDGQTIMRSTRQYRP